MAILGKFNPQDRLGFGSITPAHTFQVHNPTTDEPCLVVTSEGDVLINGVSFKKLTERIEAMENALADYELLHLPMENENNSPDG